MIKASELSAQQTQVIMQCFAEANLPKSVVNFVNGMEAVMCAEMTRHTGIDKTTFTGSTHVGKIITKDAVDSMKRVTLKLGGKAPNIILDNTDFQTVIPQALFACFINSGQVCVAATHLLVSENRLDEVNEILKATVANVIKVDLSQEADPTIVRW